MQGIRRKGIYFEVAISNVLYGRFKTEEEAVARLQSMINNNPIYAKLLAQKPAVGKGHKNPNGLVLDEDEAKTMTFISAKEAAK
jgi:hypothetical protein